MSRNSEKFVKRVVKTIAEKVVRKIVEKFVEKLGKILQPNWVISTYLGNAKYKNEFDV